MDILSAHDFYLNTKGWAFANHKGLKARIDSIKEFELTLEQKTELAEMEKALEQIKVIGSLKS
jgi:hypothetical protein